MLIISWTKCLSKLTLTNLDELGIPIYNSAAEFNMVTINDRGLKLFDTLEQNEFKRTVPTTITPSSSEEQHIGVYVYKDNRHAEVPSLSDMTHKRIIREAPAQPPAR